MNKKRNYNRYDIFISILIASLIFGGIGGALVIVRVVSILLFPVLIVKFRYCKDFVMGFTSWFVVFYCFCLVSLLWTVDTEEAVKELVYYPVHFILFLEILVFSRFSKSPLNSISFSWVVGVGLTLIVAIWELITNEHLPLALEDEVLRVGGMIVDKPFASVTFGNYNGYVVYLCMAMPFIYYQILCIQQQKGKAIFSTFILLVTIVVLLVNASRGGIISLGIMGIIFLLMTKRSKYKLLLIIALIGFSVYFIIPNIDTLFLAMTLKNEGGGTFEDPARFEIWSVALNVFESYYYVGSGVGSIGTALKMFSPNIIPITHNMFLEILVQYGVFFFIVFLGYLISLYKKARKSDSKRKIILYMALFALPIYSIIDSGYLLNPIIFTAFASLTVFACINRINPITIKDNQ